MTGQPGQTLVWDSLGRLKEVRNSSTNALISAYTYDALDRLRTVARASTIGFRYVGTSTGVAEVVDDGTNASQLKVGNGWSGERYATWTGTNSNPRYLGTNGHGDVTWSADGSGAIVNTLRYDPWGNVAAASGSSLPDWRFQGSWNDTSTGLSWVVTRWYAPGLGRFISEDSLLGEPTTPRGRHLYVYGWGDSVDAWDSSGRASSNLYRICQLFKAYCPLNETEANWCENHSNLCLPLAAVTVEVSQEVENMFTFNKWSIQNQQDACRHCYWQSLIVIRFAMIDGAYSIDFGLAQAKVLAVDMKHSRTIPSKMRRWTCITIAWQGTSPKMCYLLACRSMRVPSRWRIA